VIHLKPNKTRTDFFSPIQMAGTVVLQDGVSAWKFIPCENAWEPIPPCRMFQGDCACDCALQNYAARIVGSEDVAGRPTYVLYVSPKRCGEPVRRLWIDREHYLILGTQIETPDGFVLNSSRFVSIQINPSDISPAIFKVDGKVKAPEKAACGLGFKVLTPSYLPQGYHLAGMSRIMISGVSCAHLQFSNGVNLISFFQRKAEDNAAPPKLDCRVTNVLRCSRSGLQFTLVGNVPSTELRKIADSAR
jgi:negative regulator of sigma E activity